MSDKLLRQANIIISKQPETSLGTIYTTAADYIGAKTNALNITLPFIEKIKDYQLYGDGDEWARTAVPDYMGHTGITFADRLNISQFAILAKRFLSGTTTATEVETGVYDIVVEMKATSLDPQLESSSVGFKLGGLDFLLGGMVGNNLSVSLQGGAAPTYQVELVGVGNYKFMSEQSPALVPPTATAQTYVGHRSQNFFSFDDGTTFDVTSLGRLDSINFQASNALVQNDRRQGDPLNDSTDDNSGAYPRRLTRGDERTLSLSVGIYVDDDKRGYTAHLNNTEVTDVSFLSRGNELIGATSYPEVEIIVPKATIEAPSLGGDRKGITTFNFEPLFDPSSGEDGIWKIRFRTTANELK